MIENTLSEEVVNNLAKKTGFVKRVRKLPAFNFVNALMFSVCNQAKTSLLDISSDLNQQFGIDISKEGLHKKFNQQGVNFLKELIKLQLSKQIGLPKGNSLQKHFKAINIKDSSKFSLPNTYNGDYPGFGNFSKTNGLMNLQYEYDLLSGNWRTIQLSNIRTNDQCDSKNTVNDILKGALYIRDLGYITPTYLNAVIQEEAFFLNRLPTQINVYHLDKELLDWVNLNREFNKKGIDRLEMDVLIYKKEALPCRLVIERVSDDEYKSRLEKAQNSVKRHRINLSNKYKIRCRYNTYITNVSSKVLPLEQIRKTYYLRWQIELVFKTWKSFFEINKVKSIKKDRLECQLLAKLLWVLVNWKLFNTSNRYLQSPSSKVKISLLKFFKRCLNFSQTLRLVILNKMNLKKWLKDVFLPLIDNTASEPPSKKQTHYQTIQQINSLS